MTWKVPSKEKIAILGDNWRIPNPYRKSRKKPTTAKKRAHIRTMRRFKRRTRHMMARVRNQLPLKRAALFMGRKLEVAPAK